MTPDRTAKLQGMAFPLMVGFIQSGQEGYAGTQQHEATIFQKHGATYRQQVTGGGWAQEFM